MMQENIQEAYSELNDDNDVENETVTDIKLHFPFMMLIAKVVLFVEISS